VQGAVQVEILKELTDLARSGQLLKTSTITSGSLQGYGDYTPSRIVQVGHSYGSILVDLFLAKYPTLSDGTVFTGWIVGPTPGIPKFGTFAMQYAPEADPGRFADLGSGYMMIANQTDYQYLFLSQRTIDQGALDYYFSIRQTLTVGEILSGIPTFVTGLPAPGFTGPILVGFWIIVLRVT
jgi:hypothetical protein